jgi:hypothetical protein
MTADCADDGCADDRGVGSVSGAVGLLTIGVLREDSDGLAATVTGAMRDEIRIVSRPFQSTRAPIASATKRNGTIIVPCSISGGCSNVTCR